MPSYVVTGASRGLGYGFIKTFASDAANTVVGIVRNKAATEQQLASDNIKNVRVCQGDITNLDSLKTIAAELRDQVNGIDYIDYLICNAAYISKVTGKRNLAEFDDNPSVLEKDLKESFNTNVIGLVNTVNTFLPLVRQGSVKKIIAITSGMGDIDFVNELDIDVAAPYAISKAGVNMVVAKYNATYKEEGILFMAICPGSVDTAEQSREAPKEEDAARLQALFSKLLRYAPDFKGPVSAEDAVADIMRVVNNASLESGNGGSSVSHFGTKRWL
ncbi:NAD(P)-binding protein [Stipitochalara longipes BDJ]|nr:NAD(P)-binding protein [Stipitochalara longipes BDJ]